MNLFDGTHAVVRFDGSEVRPGDVLRGTERGPVVFRCLTSVPGDGASIRGQIIVDEPDWPGIARCPSTYGLTVVMLPDDRPRGLTREDDQWLARQWSLTLHRRQTTGQRGFTRTQEAIFYIVAGLFVLCSIAGGMVGSSL